MYPAVNYGILLSLLKNKRGIMTEKEISNRPTPFFIPREVMNLLGGRLLSRELGEERPTIMVEEGAFVWGVDNLNVGKGIFNHVCKVARKAYYTAIALREKSRELGDGKYSGLSEEAINTPEKMLVQIADYTVAQDFSTVRVRWNDVADRWVKSAVANWDKFENEGDMVEIIKKHSSEFVYKEGQKPRIEPERLSKTVEIVEKAAAEIYGYLGITEEEMNQKCQEEPAWEAALRAAWEQDYSLQKNQLRSDTPYSDLLMGSVASKKSS